MKSLIAAVCGGVIFIMAGIGYAEPIASVVAVRGKATIERAGTTLAAQTRQAIELQDTLATAEGGRAKLLFIDDSVLTLAEKSRMSIDTFVHSRSDRGKSLFNLLDGKMRAVVGRTKFEVKTPTVIAAARGTVILFEVGTRDGRSFTRVTCLEGTVEIRLLIDAPGTAPVLITPGQSIFVMSGQLLPSPLLLSPAELKVLERDTGSVGVEIKLPDSPPPLTQLPPPPMIPQIPQIRQQPTPVQPSKVDIGVKF
jgi:hypothetical protein